MSVSYYWLHFRTATAQTGLCFFCTDAIRCGQIISIGACATEFCWCGIETNKDCWMHSCRCLGDISSLNRNSLSQSASSCTGRCHSIQEAIQHWTLQICFLVYTSLFSIKSYVLELDTAQKVYFVNKGLFLGVFSASWFAYMGRYRDAIYCALINYTDDLRY